MQWQHRLTMPVLFRVTYWHLSLPLQYSMWPLANEELNSISCHLAAPQQRSAMMNWAQSWLGHRSCTLGTSLWSNMLNVVFGTHKLKVWTSCDDLNKASSFFWAYEVSNCGQCGHRSANRFGAQHPLKPHGLLQTIWAENRTLFIACAIISAFTYLC